MVPLFLLLAAAAAAARPNVVFILTDDQDTRLGEADEYTADGSLAAMPQTKALLVDEGASFTNAFVPRGVVLPRRASRTTVLPRRASRKRARREAPVRR